MQCTGTSLEQIPGKLHSYLTEELCNWEAFVDIPRQQHTLKWIFHDFEIGLRVETQKASTGFCLLSEFSIIPFGTAHKESRFPVDRHPKGIMENSESRQKQVPAFFVLATYRLPLWQGKKEHGFIRFPQLKCTVDKPVQLHFSLFEENVFKVGDVPFSIQ